MAPISILQIADPMGVLFENRYPVPGSRYRVPGT